MAHAITPGNLTRGQCLKLTVEMLEAYAAIAARHGLKAPPLTRVRPDAEGDDAACLRGGARGGNCRPET